MMLASHKSKSGWVWTTLRMIMIAIKNNGDVVPYTASPPGFHATLPYARKFSV